ncbi:MAG: hypothetical protein JHC95_11110 [Solirubrobacteraceae bacterium]|nr:hypothetical protein [Solirubrobacteraceae bacterium]
MEHLREGYQRRRDADSEPVRSFERIRERTDGRFSRGQEDLTGVAMTERRAPVADLAPVDDLLAGWDADRPAGPIVREIVLERDDAPRRPRSESPAASYSDDRDPTGPRDVEIAELRGGRRTVEIRGRTVASPSPMAVRDTAAPAVRRRPSGGAVEVFGQRPDRIALWALLLGIVLILVAIGSGDASAATL